MLPFRDKKRARKRQIRKLYVSGITTYIEFFFCAVLLVVNVKKIFRFGTFLQHFGLKIKVCIQKSSSRFGKWIVFGLEKFSRQIGEKQDILLVSDQRRELEYETNRNRRDLTRRFLPKFFLLPYGTLPKAKGCFYISFIPSSRRR